MPSILIPSQRKTNRRGIAPTLPMVSGEGESPQTIELALEQWKDIGGSYCDLSEDDRITLNGILNRYLMYAADEPNVAKLSESLDILRKTSDIAIQLYDIMTPHSHAKKRDAYYWATTQLQQMGEKKSSNFSACDIMSFAAGISHCCKHIIAQFEKEPTRGIRNGDAWHTIEYGVMQWAIKKGLKITITRKAETNRNWPSPFVSFFQRLTTSLLPREFQRYTTAGQLTDHLCEARKRMNRHAENKRKLTPSIGE